MGAVQARARREARVTPGAWGALYCYLDPVRQQGGGNQLNDYSGNGIDAFNNVAGEQLVFAATPFARSRNPGWTADGSNDFTQWGLLANPAWASWKGTDGWHFMFFLDAVDNAAVQELWNKSTAATKGIRLINVESGTRTQLNIIATASSNEIIVQFGSGALSTFGECLAEFAYDGSETGAGAEAFVNGDVQTPTVTADTLTESITVATDAFFARLSDGTQDFQGTLGFFAAWFSGDDGQALTESGRHRLRRQLARRFSPTAALELFDLATEAAWAWQCSVTPFTTDSPLWSDDLTTQCAYPGADQNARTVYAIENMGSSSHANDTLRSYNRTAGTGAVLTAADYLSRNSMDFAIDNEGLGSGTNLANGIVATLTQPFDVLCIWRQASAGVLQVLFDASAGETRCFAQISASEVLGMYGGTSVIELTDFDALVTDEIYAGLFHFEGASSYGRLWDNTGVDIQDAISTPGSGDWDMITMGATQANGAAFRGDKFLTAAFPGGLATLRIEALDTWLSTEWGLG